MNTRKSIDSEAIAWASRLQSAASDEKAAFEYWLNSSVEHKNAFARVEAALRAADRLEDELLAEEFERQLFEADAESMPESQGIFRWAAAASLAFAVLAASVMLATFPRDAATILESEIGRRTAFTLEDQSQIELNSKSAVRVAYSQRRREVELLRGEAFFQVQEDASRPFVLTTPTATVTVTGTAFNVKVGQLATSVVVVSGAVAVAPLHGSPNVVESGQSVDVAPTGVGPVRKADVEAALSWRVGKLSYVNEPLEQVVADLNRHFAVPIVVSDQSLRRKSVTGEFETSDQSTAVAALCTAFNLTARPVPGAILLVPSADEQ